MDLLEGMVGLVCVFKNVYRGTSLIRKSFPP